MAIHNASRSLGISLVALAIGGCATVPAPIRLQGPDAGSADSLALLWSYNLHRDGFFERPNHVYVKRVSDTGIRVPTSSMPALSGRRPVVLAAGQYAVEIEYKRDSLLCGYFGCVQYLRDAATLSLRAEAGHSYAPQAKTHCGTHWIWIEDLGVRAEEDMKRWRRGGDFPYTQRGSIVVAGEAPPAACPAKPE